MQKYITHFNLDRPFIVEYDDKQINVFLNKNSNLLFTITKYTKVFIGTSNHVISKTRISKKYKGNTVLIQLDKYRYLYVGSSIIYFETDSEIIDYVSNMNDNLVPSPYGITTDNKYYLIMDNVNIYGNIHEYYKKNKPYMTVYDPVGIYYRHKFLNNKQNELKFTIDKTNNISLYRIYDSYFYKTKFKNLDII